MEIELENPIYDEDEYLMPFKRDINRRHEKFIELLENINKKEGLDKFSKSYKNYGLHVTKDNEIIGLEWVPGAESVYLRGDFNDWRRTGKL